MKRYKLIGILVIVIIASTMFLGLGVKPVRADIFLTENQMTSNSADQENPDIYEYAPNSYAVVWQDNRNGNWDIYMYYQAYLGNGSWNVYWDTPVTANSGNNINPKIYNDTIVYQSDRNGNWDIYMYNITSKVETQITSNSAVQSNPAIYGDAIVWQDARNAVWDDHYWDYVPWNIYMYNLTTHTEKRVTPQGEDCLNPAISGDCVAYIKDALWRSPYSGLSYYTPYVYYYNFSTGLETLVAYGSLTDANSPNNVMNSPAISGVLVAWTQLGADWNVGVRNVTNGAMWSVAHAERPDVYGNYVVYEGYSNGNWDIYLYDFVNNVLYDTTANTWNQENPAITDKYFSAIVYQDNRHGNWDIYLTGFWFGAGGGVPGPAQFQEPLTPSLVISYLQQVRSAIADTSQMPTSDFAGANNHVKENRRNAILNQLDSAIASIQAAADTQDLNVRRADCQSAIDQLNSLINKTDGWSLRGSADMPGSGYTPDWITSPFYEDQTMRFCVTELQTLYNNIS